MYGRKRAEKNKILVRLRNLEPMGKKKAKMQKKGKEKPSEGRKEEKKEIPFTIATLIPTPRNLFFPEKKNLFISPPPASPPPYTPSSTLLHLPSLRIRLPLLLLLDLEQQRAIDMRQDTPKRDRRPDQSVEFLVAADRELQVARGDSFHFQVFSRVAGEFEDFRCEVLEYGGYVDGGWVFLEVG